MPSFLINFLIIYDLLKLFYMVYTIKKSKHWHFGANTLLKRIKNVIETILKKYVCNPFFRLK